jgi:arginase
MKGIHLIEVSSEIGAGTRGSSLGIHALKIAALEAGSDYFSRYPAKELDNYNEVLSRDTATKNALYITEMVKNYHIVMEGVDDVLQQGQFPLVLAADHASAGGTIAGIKKAMPEKRLGVIWIDAHADLHSPYTSPTGNMHGMPLATALAEDNLEQKCNSINKKTREKWEELKACGSISPKINAEDLVFFGVRDAEKEEKAIMDKYGIPNFTVDECRKQGFEKCCKQALQHLADCDILYISFDVDSMDPETVSYGTGTPVDEGFKPEEAEKIIRCILQSGKVAAFEMVEINPLLDNKGNKMAETAFGILNNITPLIEEQGV